MINFSFGSSNLSKVLEVVRVNLLESKRWILLSGKAHFLVRSRQLRAKK